MASQTRLFDDATSPSPSTDNSDALMLATFAEKAYLDYAVSVVKGRALPDVSDGQKPVQRRILYAMHELGLGDTAKPRKSAAVVGDVLGKLHPHGDQSVYDALVRMAQDFMLRYPLIDGQGNFGSRDGDGAAAMRYTEARLTPIAQLLLEGIEQDTVDFQANYDGSFEEPRLLPARLPIILLNGASGIAVGMATEIPSHNLNEVSDAIIALINDAELSDDALAQYIPGPDFPSGGQIITPQQTIADIYKNGRGSVKVRARWEIEDLARGQWQVVVTELPPNTSSQKVLEEIEELTNPKIKTGKKALSADQLAQKQLLLSVLDTVRDESGRDAPVRLVLEPKSRNLDKTEFMQALLAHTSLEGNASINLVMIGRDGRPRQKSIGDILREWIDFRFDTATRQTKWRLQRIEDRIHILEGRERVLLNIDEVIAIIRESDEPKAALIAAFNLSERQAEDILEIRLRQLARLEAIKIQQELANLREEQKIRQDLLDNPRSMKKSIVSEIKKIQKRFGDPRRTLIEEAQRASVEHKVVDEPITAIISGKGWVRSRNGHNLTTESLNFKSGDALYAVFECRTVDHLIAFGQSGRVYSTPISSLPSGRGDGVPITTLIEPANGDVILHYFASSEDTTLLLATDKGLGFSSQIKNMLSRGKGGKAFITLDEGSTILRPQAITSQTTALSCISENGALLVFNLSELKALSNGGRGVILQNLDEKDQLADVAPINNKGVLLSGLRKNGKAQEVRIVGAAFASYQGKRARKGKLISQKLHTLKLKPIE